MASKISTKPEIDEIPLPTKLAEAFHYLDDRDTHPETLQEGFRIIKETFDAADIDVLPEDMYQGEPTRHEVTIDESVEYVPCVLDALIVALSLEERPIRILSEPPNGGEPVRFLVAQDEITVTPERAVISFGMGFQEAADVDPKIVKEKLSEKSATPTSCTLTNAFPNSETYARWADDVSGVAVMELDVEEVVAIAQQFS